MNLKGSVAVLSGAGRVNGVGAATARLLAMEGCHVVINCLHSKDQAQNVIDECKEYGVMAELFLGDVTNGTVCQAMAAMVNTKFGRTDILVNALGFTKSASYEKLSALSADDFSKLYAINVIGPYLMCEAFQPMLSTTKNGVVVNVSSAAGINGKGSSIAYAAAKGGENTLTLALAQALSPEVRVNAVCPGFIDSSWWEVQFRGKEEEYQKLIKGVAENNLLGKVLKPIDVAQVILGIIKNPVMTGELIRLDAGAHIGKANVK